MFKRLLRGLISSLPFLPIPVRAWTTGDGFVHFWWVRPSSNFDLRWGRAQYRGADVREIAVLPDLIQPGDTVLDVGSYHGLYSVVASRLNPRGEIIAFEPSDRERRVLERNLRLNCETCRVEPYALSRATGTLDFHVVEDGYRTMNSLRRPPDQASSRSVPVQALSLDDFCDRESLRRLDFLKLDTEGGELDALRGAEQSIRRFRPCIQVEVLDWVCEAWGYAAREILIYLLDRDYMVYEYPADGGLRPHELQSAYPDIANYLCVPAEDEAMHTALRQRYGRPEDPRWSALSKAH